MGKDLLEELAIIFREVFEDETITLSRNTTATDIEQWDSLTHIEMIVAVEKHFSIRFNSMDLKKLENVGDLTDMIQQKRGA
ncbi:MAG TPA: acyl carrier protein [Flavisolibacter sp.]|nr:acyl carrier protein [Flavisolibacter sp.]